MLDAASYPHVLDAIWAAVDRPALLALRTACKAWCTRADIALAAHLVITHVVTGDLNALGYAPGVVRLSTPSGRHPRLEFPDSLPRELLRATEVIDLVGPVRVPVLGALRPLLANPIVRCFPADGLPLPQECVSAPPDGPPHLRLSPALVRPLPDDGHFSVIVYTHLSLYGLGHPSETSSGQLTGRRWVSVVTFDPNHLVSAPNPTIRGRAVLQNGSNALPVRDECVWILRPKLGMVTERTNDVHVVECLAAWIVRWLHRHGTGYREDFVPPSAPTRFKLVGLDALRREDQVLQGLHEWEGVDWDEDEGMEGDEEDGAGGRVWRRFRAFVRFWDKHWHGKLLLYHPIIDNLRLFTLEAYRDYLLATPGLGARAVELELGDGALVHR